MSGSPGITIQNKYTKATGSVYSVSIPLSPAPAQGDLEVAIIYGYNTSNQCYTLTVPPGWTEYDRTASVAIGTRCGR